MSLIQVPLGTLNDVPDRPVFKPIPPGVYCLQITEAKVEPNKAGTGNNLIVTARVDSGVCGAALPDHALNKTVTRYMACPKADDDAETVTNRLAAIKQLFLGCGISLNGASAFDTSLLQGAKFNAQVSNRTYQTESGETRESSDISRILKTDGSQF